MGYFWLKLPSLFFSLKCWLLQKLRLPQEIASLKSILKVTDLATVVSPAVSTRSVPLGKWRQGWGGLWARELGGGLKSSPAPGTATFLLLQVLTVSYATCTAGFRGMCWEQAGKWFIYMHAHCGSSGLRTLFYLSVTCRKIPEWICPLFFAHSFLQ